MITGRPKERINKKMILDKIDDYNIIKYYLGQDFDFKKKFKSPFRKDKNPNLSFYMGSNGKILFKDFANGASGDCFDFVQKVLGLNYSECLQRIDTDLFLGINSNNTNPKQSQKLTINLSKRPDSIHKSSKIVQIIPRDFTKNELEYWEQYHITEEELKRKHVLGIEKLYVNKQLIPNYNKELRFAYLFDNYLKIYSPFSKDFKWVSSTPNDFISGFDEIKYKMFSGKQDSKLIISKSVKDEIVLSKFFKDVCSTQNESSGAINEKDMNVILNGYKPENVYICYDNDRAGVEASLYFTQKYGFRYVNVPKIFRREGIKDWSDLVKLKDLDTMENYLKIKKLI